MAYLITTPSHFFFLKDLNFRTISVPLAIVRRGREWRGSIPPSPAVYVSLESCYFGFGEIRRSWSWCCCGKGDWESEGDTALEAEILEFMKGTEKPGLFPTKKELVEAGRLDLVEAIVNKGGWLSMGWDSDQDEIQEIGAKARDCGDEAERTQESVRAGADYGGNVSVGGVVRDSHGSVERVRESNFWFSASSSPSPSSSGRSFGVAEDEETGVEGILTRLEKQRNSSFGLKLGEYPLRGDASDDLHMEASEDIDSDRLRKSRGVTSASSLEGILTNSGGKFSPSKSLSDVDGSWSSLKPEMWRTWSMLRAGFSIAEFEAAEISFNDDISHEVKDTLKDEILAITEGSSEALDEKRNNSPCNIRTRLQHLELELVSSLRSLRSKRAELVSKEDHETANNLQKLSDALEFQENEIMNSTDRLRSIRAKLAVLEGKMALATIDAQKIIDKKQKKIDGARRALELLRTTCVVWPNSASEVLLVGSFDGWTTQRKMKKSSSGIFSVSLKLYPGRYEIKFIVDGVWRTDPLRPIVQNNGHENNLFIVM